MRISNEDIIKLLLNFIDEGDRVLDAGCGDCSRLKEIKNFRDINAFGVDILIPQSCTGCDIICREMRAEDIDELPGNFNLIFTAYSFHHFKIPEKFLAAAKNKLSSSGKLIIIDWKYGAVTDNPDEEYYNPEQVSEFLVDAGFKIKDKFLQGDTWIFIAF